MKKFFNYTLALLAVASICMVSCKKDDKTDDGTDNNTTEEYAGPVTGTSNWSVIGSLTADAKVNMNWDNDIVMAESNGIFVVKNLKLAAADAFKIRYQKDWAVNRGGTFAALGQGFDVEPDGDNIIPALDGIYDVYYNPEVEQMAVCAKDATPTWSEKTVTGTQWDYVLDQTNYLTNSTFTWEDDPIKMSGKNITMEWKFYSTHWNNYKFNDKGDDDIQLYSNRLGGIYNISEKGLLLRFSNDGQADGQLCLNAPIFGVDQDQVCTGEGDSRTPYIWSLNEWHVLTLTCDGTTTTLYDNGEVISTYDASSAWDEWRFQRLDFSMTWKEGSTKNDWPYKQHFDGYSAFVRIWDRCLSAGEVKAGLCDVPADSEGLKAYWAFNLDEGHVVKNLVGNATYDLDFSNAWDGNDGKYDASDAVAGAWTSVDEIENGTVCAE